MDIQLFLELLQSKQRALIDQVAWDSCLARLPQPTTNMPIKEVEDAKKISRQTKTQSSYA